MIKQHRFLLFICGFVILVASALWPASFSPRAYANVTLVSFTARSLLAGQPEIYIEWETATQFGTVGFFVTRSDSATGTFTRVSEFIPREGDDLTGWVYDPWIDEDTTLGNTYWYKLEEITNSQDSEFYGPIAAVAGVPATVTPTATHTPTATPTPTRTRTFTPSPTATPTTRSNATPVAASTTSSSSAVVVTPRVVTGATVTPRPTSLSGSSNPTVAATPQTSVVDSPQQPQTVATSVPSAPDVAAVTVAPPAPAAVEVAQVADPTLVPADAAPAIVAPAVVVTEAPPAPVAADSTNGSALLLVAAAFLFLGIAFVILRQARS